jgi:primosomal protein N'
MIKCKLCESEFDETKYDGNCPACGEKYYIISMTDYQKLVEELQEKQFEIEELYNQVSDLQYKSNQFKNILRRESAIYCNFHVWLKSILKDFNIPKQKDYWVKPYYNKPNECQIYKGKICNGCGDC